MREGGLEVGEEAEDFGQVGGFALAARGDELGVLRPELVARVDDRAMRGHAGAQGLIQRVGGARRGRWVDEAPARGLELGELVRGQLVERAELNTFRRSRTSSSGAESPGGGTAGFTGAVTLRPHPRGRSLPGPWEAPASAGTR